MSRDRLKLIVLVLICLAAARPAGAEDAWRARAVLEAPAPGLIEAVVPPELVDFRGRDQMDIDLIDPDGRPRAFELYWRELTGPSRIRLEPARVQLEPDNGFIWEAELHERLVFRRLYVTLNGQGAVGRVDVYGRLGDQWSALASNAAVFAASNGQPSAIDIPPDTYTALRLRLMGYDRGTRQTLAPIDTVIAEGDHPGRDYAERTLTLTFRQSESEGMQVIEAVLPGDGLWIGALHLQTEAQFLGAWQAGRERISEGSRRFEALVSGRTAHVAQTPGELGLDLNRPWPGRSLVLKLDAGERYIGAATGLTVTVRLPRLAFAAEKAGRYTARTGMATVAVVHEVPGDGQRKPQAQVSFSPPETNPRWHLASLVEKYHLKGGPFIAAGYTWRAPVSIPAPGYYRLPLNLRASLASRRAAVRIVRDDIQVPYVTGAPEGRTLEPESDMAYDARKNLSTWTVRLPQASPYWTELTFYAGGIFKRTVEFQKPKPGTRDWQPWRQTVWENREERESALRLNLRDLPDDTTVIRLRMAHGDNQPLPISRITAGYTSPTVYFLAQATGDYLVYGGNPEAHAPRYDLSLVQAELFSALPTDARMGELETLDRSGWQNRFMAAFKEKGWGLYAVLGAVTLALLVVIVRLFPKPGDKTS